MYRGRTPITVVQQVGERYFDSSTGTYVYPTRETTLWGDLVPSSPELILGAGTLRVQSRVLLPAAWANIQDDGPVKEIQDPRGNAYTVGAIEPHYARTALHHFEAVATSV